MNHAETAEWNWSKTHRFTATRIHRPTHKSELQQIIADAAASNGSLRCVGSRHSFTAIADAAELLDLSALPERFEIAPDQQTVTITGAMTYARLGELLEPHDLAIANTASLPHLTVAGAIGTGTHGSGDHNGNLATSVRGLSIATTTGEVRHVSADDPDLGVAAISLGALGAIVSIDHAIQPAFDVEQVVHDDLSWHCVLGSFDELFGSAYSVSVFTDWQDRLQLWTKRRVDQAPIDHGVLHDGTLAAEGRHPVLGEDPAACTPQGPAGLWSNRLPHFRADAIPSVGAEVQSEFFVDRSNTIEALERLRSIGADLEPMLMASEIRTVARDDLWLSPQYNRDCVAFHFTWHHDLSAARQAAHRVADALAPLSPLPHWGKVFSPDQFDLAALYPRLGDALDVVKRWDPAGMFTNQWMRETIHKQS